MRRLRTTHEPVRHLPLQAFLRHSKRDAPADPAPHALLFLAVVFTLSAVFVL